jgi:RimK family alpha-L-glutamate ligase
VPEPGPLVALVGWPQEANVLLVAAWVERGIAAELLEPADALARLGPGDIAVSRLDVLPTLDGVEPGLEAIDELAARGVRVVNRVGPIVAAHDKLQTAQVLAAAGLPHPRTVHVSSAADRVSLTPPLVVKPRFGSWGADVFRCQTAAELADVFAAVRGRSWFTRHGALVQELLPPVGHDLRLVVASGRVVGAVERVAKPGEWRTNVSLGGASRPALPSESARALGVRAAGATGMELVGVDLFPVRGAYAVLELNAAVEFDGGYDLGDEDVYEAAADALRLPRVTHTVEAATG